ncbi:hypothetical protein B484DRAFT_448754 [Ochromonadaceae sp. CCMP2298]|nr:hypothetical protein B484DRAFT_448754 [Ochromonadaceae sp. CCMP2298]|mmetsp:Transcript_9930/g.22093  ORF Transcript_9930/g.22093 Transcript_9930/m.22093 type:complete len:852 (-) Transcript_9930:203-2758(-)|eukprot:CAMPEP_0173172968 /NCGR_PEP_ID=MMETSP1141-20130122/2587_1 /TAXON_ID=483371 /ORGANISM="non described non described, Strain CCMP2298" /LENGTH=851 /DNA_ID=CAMNT_0014095031 /DNA_START=106 /DNA_END=2661 /DNA_ORIENTATION=-
MHYFIIFAALLALVQPSTAYRLGLVPGTSRMSIGGFDAMQPLHATTESTDMPVSSTNPNDVKPKAVTKEIMAFFALPRNDKRDAEFRSRLAATDVKNSIDGLHVLTILFQSARTKRAAYRLLPTNVMLAKLKSWDRMWSERDVSTFVYGVSALECLDSTDGELLKLGAKNIALSTAPLSSRSIGNALYGLNKITSDTAGAPQLCGSLSLKITQFKGDLTGQDIGIGVYGLQGMNADVPQVRKLVRILAQKIAASESELDEQSLSNALYGLQSMSSDYPEVLELVAALSVKVAQSTPELGAQAIGSALYGLQKLSSDKLEVRTLIAALAEKVEISTTGLDAQAIGNALFGLQRMKSDSPEVRALVQAIASKIVLLEVQMDSKGIGSALYGLHSMSSDVPQVRSLLAALADRISISKCSLSGQGIADALYGLYSMTSDCPELRALLASLAERIDSTRGKLDSQEIGNALYGLQGMSSDMYEVRVIVAKLAEKIRRSKAVLRSQHVGRALLGLQRFSADSPEVRSLVKQLSRRIAESDRTKLTGQSIADALYGLQGFSSDIPEVQELIEELAKKIAITGAELTSEQLGRALFGLQSLTSSASIFEESAYGLDSDETQFLLSALWDKVKVRTDGMQLADVGLGLQGLTLLRDPIANNLRQYMYLQLLRLGIERAEGKVPEGGEGEEVEKMNPEDVITNVRALRLNKLLVPKWLALPYMEIEAEHPESPVLPLSRADKVVTQRYTFTHPSRAVRVNALFDGIRLDMHFPSAMLNVELDGPAHRYASRARYDLERDEYLTRAGYTVHRIILFGRGIDDIVDEIEEVVSRLEEEVAVDSIQKLYASEQGIQKLYTPKN